MLTWNEWVRNMKMQCNKVTRTILCTRPVIVGFKKGGKGRQMCNFLKNRQKEVIVFVPRGGSAMPP